MSDAPASSYKLLGEHGVASPVLRASWCPTMDLVAIVSADNKIAIHRLSFQQVTTTLLVSRARVSCPCLCCRSC